jgi:hypothetical protein
MSNGESGLSRISDSCAMKKFLPDEILMRVEIVENVSYNTEDCQVGRGHYRGGFRRRQDYHQPLLD